MPPLSLKSPVSRLYSVGPGYAKKLEKLEIRSIWDLLTHLPSRFEDYSRTVPISDAKEGDQVTIQGSVVQMKNQFTRTGFVFQRAQIQDSTGTLTAIWFNQPFLTKSLRRGEEIRLSGPIKMQGFQLQMESPRFEPAGAEAIHTGRLVPIYPETAGVTSKWLRAKIFWLLNQIRQDNLAAQEYLDDKILTDFNLLPLSTALFKAHFPDSLDEAGQARRRLAFDELLAVQLSAKENQMSFQRLAAGNRLEIAAFRPQLSDFVAKLPFTLTTAQVRAIDEIHQDLAKNRPMNRLLQGDVGSGKTVVAAAALFAACLNGYQSAIMAPTEVLANQHYETLTDLLAPHQISVGLVTGSRKIRANQPVVVGTHALLEDKLNFSRLGLVVVDEQHRFGVEQRAKLLAKGRHPHLLTMTATPIPRTVALTMYGDLDLSLLDEMPKNRLPVKTWLVPDGKRQSAYDWLARLGSQIFIVCPLIEESETLRTVKSAKTEFDKLTRVFPKHRLGLLHGRQTSHEKERTLNSFKNKELDILICTPVVEVGIDIPGARAMVIEAADRFGLASLHQLRGRVGRGSEQSFCLLFTENSSPAALTRLRHLEQIHDGRKLAEIDLEFRGPGQRFGLEQHGNWGLKIADFADIKLVNSVNTLVRNWESHPENFPLLRKYLRTTKILSVPN